MDTDIAQARGNSFFWKWATYALYAFFISFPFLSYNSFLYGASSSRSANLIGLVSILGIACAVWLFKKGSAAVIPKSYILLSLVVYFLFLILSGLSGLDFHTSFWSAATRTTGIWYLIHLGFLIPLLMGIFSEKKMHQRFMLAIILSTALYSFLAFLSPEGVNLLFQGLQSDGFTFGNSSFAGMYLFGAFILSLYYIFQAEAKKWWMYAMPALLVINPFILNKGIWLGDFSLGLVGEARASAYVIALSIVGVFCMWLISKIKGMKVKQVTAYSLFGASIIMVVLSAWSLFSHDGALRKAYLSEATAARPLVWEMSEKVIAQRPFLGWGTDNFERVFELNYDNRLLQQEYGNEAWFDRAHNVFIDQTIDNGFVGVALYIAIYLTIILSLIYVALKSSHRNDRALASILIVYFTLHFLELQTAFDTSISYPMVIFMIASAAILFQRASLQAKGTEQSYALNMPVKYMLGGIMIVFFFWSFIWGWIPFVRAQMANGAIRTAGNSEKRTSLYPKLLASPIDKHSFLWRTSTDFQKGIGQNPKVLDDSQNVVDLAKEAAFFEAEYRTYLEKNPNHFRAHLNLADMLIYQRLFGIDKLAEAQNVLDDAIKLVPQAPQPYWMKAVAYVYMKKFDLALEYAKKAVDLNSKIKQSQEVLAYVETSIKNFPNIDLFFFKQI